MARKRHTLKETLQHTETTVDKRDSADYLHDDSDINKVLHKNMKTKVLQNKNMCVKDNQQNPTIKTKGNKEATPPIQETRYHHSDAQIFPKNVHWLVFIVTMVFRLWYVSMPTNWWILHPDEIYQTIEVAHSEVYNYGFLTHEYTSPPPEVTGNVTMSDARAQEIKYGMFSLRSFILAKIISCVISLSETSGMSISPYMFSKYFHAIVTSTLPLSVFKFAESLCRSRDIGSLSAIFVCSSVTLNVLGTHTLINSFLAPVVFFSLVPYIRLFRHVSVQEPTKRNSSRQRIQTRKDDNWNLENVKRDDKKRVGDNSDLFLNHSSLHCTIPFITICERYMFHPTFFLSGLMSAVCIYTRPDIIIIPVLITLIFYKTCIRFMDTLLQNANFQNYVMGFITGITIGGYVDHVTYDKWFISPIQWLYFNVVHKYSSTLYGSSSWTFYLDKIIEHEPFIFILVAFVLLDLCFALYCSTSKTMHFPVNNNYSLVLFAVLLCFFSTNDHKEVRFLHNGIVLLYIAFATALVRLYNVFLRLFSNQNNSHYCIYYVYICITLFVSSHIYSFLNISTNYQAKWTYGGITDSNEVNICLDYIRQQDDVTGLFLDKPLYMSGGYTMLHKNVPIIGLNIYEFMEYDIKSRVFIKHTAITNRPMHVSQFGQISDFISVYNAPLLAKVLIQKKEYNYIVLDADREFLNVGYHEVFHVGHLKILKRSFIDESERQLREIAERIPIGSNVTILEYEGHKLKHYGLYQMAEERLIMSNRLDPTRIGPFQVLVEMYRRLGAEDRFRQVMSACRQVFSMGKCLKPYVPLKLHDEYFISKV